jgi:DNA polymerase-1
MPQYETVTTESALRSWITVLTKAKRFAVDTETTSKNPIEADLVGVSLAVNDGYEERACYIPVGHTTGETQLDRDFVLKALAPVLADPTVAKIGQNIMYDMVVLRKYGVEIENVHDTMLMSYALEGKTPKHNHGMDDLVPLHLDGRQTIRFDDVVKSELGMVGFQDVRLDHACSYAAEDADVTLSLYHVLRRKLKEAELWHVYYIDRATIPALVDMKWNGIAVSQKGFAKLEREWQEESNAALAEIIRLTKDKLAELTPAAIGNYLYNVLKIEPVKWTEKTGAPSTDAEALEALEDEHPVVASILKYKKLEKLLSTYVRPVPELVSPVTGRIHTNINPTLTNTARYSSSGPNLQNIPTANNQEHAEHGAKIRSCFVAPKGFKLVAGDYSQIELRVLAHCSQDATLIRAFKEGKDVHAATAESVFGLTEKDVSKEEWGGFRRKAKTINFGLVYGITQHGLAKQLKCDPDTAQEFIDRYFEALPGVLKFIERQKKFLHTDGFTETIFGRRINQPGIRGNRAMVGHAERAGVNAVIQGSAADLIRLALANTRARFIEQDIPAALLLTVHDENIVEVEDEDVQRTIGAMKYAMETSGDDIDWLVPIIADVKSGQSWHDAH